MFTGNYNDGTEKYNLEAKIKKLEQQLKYWKGRCKQLESDVDKWLGSAGYGRI